MAETLKIGDKGASVVTLQEALNKHGVIVKVDGDFGPTTDKKVKEFQSAHGLSADGVVGDNTWAALNASATPKSGFVYTDQILEKGEYYDEIYEKLTIYLHHTAGGHRPDWVIHAWDTDDTIDATGKKTPRSVATAYVIGGRSTRDRNDTSFDGKIFRAFDDKYWAHHLGATYPNNRILNKQSVAVEICNYGPLTKGSDGKYYTYVNSPVPEDMVVKLDKPFKGYIYYHAYTDKQIEATKQFILAMKAKYPKIALKTPLFTADGFELNANAKAGVPGVYTHTNVRTDKFDLYPDPRVLKMLKEICSPQ